MTSFFFMLQMKIAAGIKVRSPKRLWKAHHEKELPKGAGGHVTL